MGVTALMGPSWSEIEDGGFADLAVLGAWQRIVRFFYWNSDAVQKMKPYGSEFGSKVSSSLWSIAFKRSFTPTRMIYGSGKAMGPGLM